MHPDLERIMKKVADEHPPVATTKLPEVEASEPPIPTAEEKLRKMFGENLGEVRRDAAAHARQIESTHPDL